MVLATIIRPGALESLDVSGQPITLAYLKAFVCMAIMGGPLFEEPGWTGFAQPRLQQMYVLCSEAYCLVAFGHCGTCLDS